MQLLIQDKDYNCGTYAMWCLLQLNGYLYNVSYLEQSLGTNKKTGTSHEQIFSFLNEASIAYTTQYGSSLEKIITPSIVNYQWDGEGHYGVILCITNLVCIYDPLCGEIQTLDKKRFNKIWYSRRYGKKWYLTLK